MATTTSEEEGVKSRCEFKCMHSLYYVLDSQNGFSSEMIVHRTSFDEECRKIQYGAEFATSSRGRTPEEDAQIDHLMESSHKLATETSLRFYESCLCQSDDPTSSNHKRPAAQLGAKFGSKPFSSALEVLSSDKDLLVMELLSESYCLPQNCINSLQTEKQAVTLKPGLQKRQHSGRFACHCSSGEAGDGSRVTSLSVREIKRKLKHTFGSNRRIDSDHLPTFRLPHGRSIFGYDCIYNGVETNSPLNTNTNAKAREKVAKKEAFMKVGREPAVAGEAEIARKKIDVSRDVLSEKHGVDVAATSRLQNPWRVMSSLEMESCFIPRRESLYFSGSAEMNLISPSRESIYLSPCGDTTGSTSSFLVEEERITQSPYIKFNDMPNVAGMDDVHQTEAAVISNTERPSKIKLMHSLMDSILENETFSDVADDFPSSPTLEMSDNNKNQEEYQSPVSVLDQFFAEDPSSPSNMTFQSARGTLKPKRLHFEEHKLAFPSQVIQTEYDPCKHEQDYTVSNYVRLILEASSLNWDQLSAMRLLSQHLLHPSLLDQAQFLQFDPHFDTKLLFNHINEVLLETQAIPLFISILASICKAKNLLFSTGRSCS
ncbi:uncharacterized protein LOC121754473 [Salvia splendens]|uniref:uncharacterized protein LOC121754473 n=1 Tax=Salvia splendens TaxID=180675 RepID=UPI001C27C958|nr:uncharacterized protein LOC121754473 [Salvia splendens]